MKKILFLIYIAVSFNSYSQNPVFTQLSQINLANYVEKPVDSILSLLPPGYTSGFVGYITSNKVKYFFAKYSDGTKLVIYVKDYQFMNPIDPNRVWNIDQFKHEAVWYVRLWHYNYPPKTSSD